MIQLSRRDKFAIAIGASALLVFALIQWVVFPVLDRQASLADALQRQTAVLAETRALAQEIAQMRAVMSESLQRRATQTKGFNLFSFLDGLAARSGLKGNIVYMKPSVSKIKNTEMSLSTVEMKLEAIQLNQLVQFLHLVETSTEEVTIRRMSLLTTGKDQKTLNAVLEIAAIQA